MLKGSALPSPAGLMAWLQGNLATLHGIHRAPVHGVAREGACPGMARGARSLARS